jgi:NDP-sugar pyrophosphorylase family protein
VLDLGDHAGAIRRVVGFREKPEIDHSVSMGVYMLSGRVRGYVPAGQRFDLPDLVWRLLEAGEPVGSFAYDGYWLDIGRHDDYAEAIDQYDALKSQLVPSFDRPPATVTEIFPNVLAAQELAHAMPVDAALPPTGT